MRFASKIDVVLVLKNVVGTCNTGVVPTENIAQLYIDPTVCHVVDVVKTFAVIDAFSACNGVVRGNFANPKRYKWTLQKVVGTSKGAFEVFGSLKEVLGILRVWRIDRQEFFTRRQGNDRYEGQKYVDEFFHDLILKIWFEGRSLKNALEDTFRSQHQQKAR